MDRTLIFALLALLLATSVSAATGSYYVVVGKDSPVTDVITGANFAASMKGSAAVTFASTMDTDLYPDLAASTMQYQMFAVIDGKRVRLVGGLHGDAWDSAKLYFQRQGFSVIEVASGYTPDDILLHPAPKEAPKDDSSAGDSASDSTPPALDTQPPSPVIPDDTALIDAQVNDTQENETAVIPASNVSSNQTGSGMPGDAPPRTDANERPGVFRRFWSWVTGLFG